jgi:hypothetical protein
MYIAGGDRCSALVTQPTCEATPTCVWNAAATPKCRPTGSGVTCSNSADRAMDLHAMQAAANFYAPWGKLATPQNVLIYGSLFTGHYDISQQTTIHFDTAVVNESENCGECTGTGCTGMCESCRDCDNQACLGGTCGPCAVDSDCCAPLLCFAGSCILF